MKIDFMAGLPAEKKPAGVSLGLEVGQTWRNRVGATVTVVSESTCPNNIPLHIVRREFGLGTTYSVSGAGISIVHGTDRYDLVERVSRVYIAGPMSGHSDLNFPAFNAAAAEYRNRGCFVINPAEINGGPGEAEAVARMTPEEYQAHWSKCMRRDIAELVTCDTIVMLSGWGKSKGARVEHHVARELGFTICYPVDTYAGA